MVRKYMVSVVAMIAIIAMVVAGCTTPTPEPPPPPPTERTEGLWLDEIVIGYEPEQAKGVTRLAAGEFEVYAHSLDTRDLFDQVMSYPDLQIKESFGSFNTLRVNPYGPTFEDGSLNPFHYAEVRAAIHNFLDRDYYADNVMGGMAEPKYTCLNVAFGDASRYADILDAIEDEYGYDPVKGMTKLSAAMLDIEGVTWDEDNGKWLYNGEPVSVTIAIREDDPVRLVIGGAVASSLREAGFDVVTKQGDMAAMLDNLVNVPAQITSGGWNLYTGGWVLTAIARDELWWPLYFHTNAYQRGIPAYKYLHPMDWEDPYEGGTNPFYGSIYDLFYMNFETMEERRELAEIVLPGLMEQASMMYLVDTKGFSPLSKEVDLAADGSGGIYGSWLWALTAHFRDAANNPIFGGQLRIAAFDLLVSPWNPVAGSNTVYDMFPIRATGDMGLHFDTRNGLVWPSRIERAEVYAREGLPIGISRDLGHTWLDFTFVPANSPSLVVPADAWADWDATTQTFLTAESRFGAPENRVAQSMSIAYYPKDIFEVPLHDGSTLSMGDFIMYAIIQFDRAKEESAIFDEGRVSSFDTFMASFMGVQFITDDPDYGLIVKRWLDSYELDAELMVSTWWPNYAQGPGFWHTVTLGIMAEAEGRLAFGDTKASEEKVPWTSFISGESLPILKGRLDAAIAGNYTPYAPTLGQYITEDEVAERYANLAAWYEDKGHFWVGSGPYYVEQISTLPKFIRLLPFEEYPDPRDKWLFLLQPIG